MNNLSPCVIWLTLQLTMDDTKNGKCQPAHRRIQRVNRPPPPQKKKKKWFLSIGPFPFIITKLPCQHSMLGHQRHASETPFKWCFAGGPMIGRIYSVVVFGSSVPSSTKNRCQSWTPSGKTLRTHNPCHHLLSNTNIHSVYCRHFI